ncbi:MAG: hypothetical protein QXV42_01600 [Ignisphaera sp.]
MGLRVVKERDYEVICDGKVVVASWKGGMIAFKIESLKEYIEKLLSLLPEEVPLVVRKVLKEVSGATSSTADIPLQ